MIEVRLSRVEAESHKLAGDAPEGEIGGIIYLVLTARGMNSSDAQHAADVFTQKAKDARRKIHEARRYKIVIENEAGVVIGEVEGA
jgi:hypothetical protein